MKTIIIKSKSYFPISTLVDGKTIKIPSKGKDLKISMSKITDHIKDLSKRNLIQIVEK